MFKIFFLENLNKYASKWVVLIIDLLLLLGCFIFSNFIRYIDLSILKTTILAQLPIIVFAGLISFLLVGSYKGIIRHTGTKDVFNVFFGVLIVSNAVEPKTVSIW